jgi:hypothetical protein
MVYPKAEVLDGHVLKFTNAQEAFSYYDFRRNKFIWIEGE